MVSNAFRNNLDFNIHRDLKGLLLGPPQFRTIGSMLDLSKGLMEQFPRLMAVSDSSYNTEQFFHARVVTADELIKYMDFVCPAFDIRGRTAPGIGTFMTYIPASVKETYVERGGMSSKLHPLRYLLDPASKGKVEPTSPFLEAFNTDKRLRKLIRGLDKVKARSEITISIGGVGMSYYEVKLDRKKNLLGYLAVVPYQGSSILIAREAGRAPAVDRPDYSFLRKFDAFRATARHILDNPAPDGDMELRLPVDRTIEILLKETLPLLEQRASPPTYRPPPPIPARHQRH